MAEAEVHNSEDSASISGDSVEDAMPLPITEMFGEFPLINMEGLMRLENILTIGKGQSLNKLKHFLLDECFEKDITGEKFVTEMLNRVFTHEVKIGLNYSRITHLTKTTLVKLEFFKVLKRAFLEKFPNSTGEGSSKKGRIPNSEKSFTKYCRDWFNTYNATAGV